MTDKPVPQPHIRELLENIDYLMSQVDPVCWIDRRLARETHLQVIQLLKSTRGEDHE